MAEANVEKDSETSAKVSDVRRQFMTSADAVIAQRLQQEEFGKKYQWNRETRKVARVDVPLAKTVHSAEEERLQKERFNYLQQQSRITEEDAQVARRLQQEEQLHGQREKELLTENDAEVARKLQREEEQENVMISHMITDNDAAVALRMQREEETANSLMSNMTESNDARIALEMQKQEILQKERDRVKREMQDQALAKKFQEQEVHLVEMKRREQELRQQRYQLEQELLQEMQLEENPALQVTLLDRNQRPSQSRNTVAMLGGGSDGFRLSQADFMSDADRRELLKMQDEELAKALQEHEVKKAGRARRDIAADIERHDAQLARIIQEVEKLELAKRQRLEAGGTYLLLPVPHVDPVHTTSSSVRSNAGGVVTSSTHSTSSSSFRSNAAPVRNNSIPNSHEYANVSPAVMQENTNSSQVVRQPSNTPLYSPVNRNRIHQTSTSSNESEMLSSGSVSLSPLNSPPPPTTSPPLAPPPPPLPSGTRPTHTTVTHTKVTETHVTSQPSSAASSRNSVRQKNNNQPGARESPASPLNNQGNAGMTPVRRQSSKSDKNCKQQ